MKVPGSISLSLPVMAGAKQVIIAACGVSDKYPKVRRKGPRPRIEGGLLGSADARGSRFVKPRGGSCNGPPRAFTKSPACASRRASRRR